MITWYALLAKYQSTQPHQDNRWRDFCQRRVAGLHSPELQRLEPVQRPLPALFRKQHIGLNIADARQGHDPAAQHTFKV
jgi:hypothetical protein